MSCNQCKSNPCGCNQNAGCCDNVVPSCPTPFYAGCAPTCLEDHTLVQVRQTYAIGVRVENSFNMPDCGESVELKITGLTVAAIGSYLWNSSVGYLEIITYDPTSGIVTAQNNCTTGNASAGTQFPSCSVFVVSPPPSVTGGTNPDGIFVALDFTAPAVSTCLLITVTEVTGISAGNNVQIGGGTYRVSAVNSATTITICNDGAGLTPGSPVIAKNGSGAYQYPVTLITVNPCDLDAVQTGTVIVCDGGVAKGLTGDASGQVLVLQDPVTGEAEYVTLSVQERTCTLIQCCLVLVPGTFTYVITVADSSQFLVGDVVQIGTRSDRWTINVIIDATHIQATTDTNPPAVLEIPEGTTLCNIDCCEEIQLEVDELFCGYQVYTKTIPLLYQVENIVLDGAGYMALRLNDLITYTPTEDCEPNQQVTAHLFVGVWTDIVTDTFFAAPAVPGPDVAVITPTLIYNEVEAVWDVGAIPQNNRAGKMVWTETIGAGKGAFPLDVASLFNQAPANSPLITPYPARLNYHGNYIEASAQINNTQATTLTLYFRTMPSEEFPPASYSGNQFGVYVVGWLEIKRYLEIP